MILTVHFCLNMLSLADMSGHLGAVIDLHTHLITVVRLDEIGTGFNAQHFALNGVEAIQGQTQAQSAPTRQDPDDFGNRYHGGLLGLGLKNAYMERYAYCAINGPSETHRETNAFMGR